MPAYRVSRLLLLVLAVLAWWPVSAHAQPSLGLALDDTAITRGDTLTARVTVANPGGGPAADVYFVVVLPDGATAVSTGPGVGARFGRLQDLRTLVPVVRGISLGSAFQYANDAFFSHTFSGVEPLGTYRIYFATLTAGALNDGVIGGGELLALVTADFTVGLGPQGTVDASRRVTAAVTPAQGGSVETVQADGTVLRLTAPPGAVGATTQVAIAPLTGITGLPPGRFIAGVAAGPAGQRFSPSATLHVELSPSTTVPPLGLVGFVVDDDGRNLRFLPATVSASGLTMSVPHFSYAGFYVLDDWMAGQCRAWEWYNESHARICGDLQSAEQRERLRMIEEDDDLLSDAFRNEVASILGIWLEALLLPRLQSAITPTPVDPFTPFRALESEWIDWVILYEPLFGDVSDRTNAAAGRRLGALIDQAQDRYRQASEATMNALNQQCLQDKARVAHYVEFAFTRRMYWDFQAHAGLPFQTRYCIGIAIDAAVPPVLTPGVAANMIVDIRARFTDGEERVGQPLSVSLSGTNATVTPGGGILASPVARQVSLLPTTTSSVVTVSAAFTGTGTIMDYLDPTTEVFQAGGPPAGPVVTSAVLDARFRAELPGVTLTDSASRSGANATLDAALVASRSIDGAAYDVDIRTDATRAVTTAAGQATVIGSGSKRPTLVIGNPQFSSAFASARAVGGNVDSLCFDLDRAYAVDYVLTTNSPTPVGSGTSNAGAVSLNVFGQLVRGTPAGTTAGTTTAAAGAACLTLFIGDWVCTADNRGVVTCPRFNPLTWSYTLTLRPAP